MATLLPFVSFIHPSLDSRAGREGREDVQLTRSASAVSLALLSASRSLRLGENSKEKEVDHKNEIWCAPVS